MIGWLWRFIVGRFSECEHRWETKGNVELLRGSRKIGTKKHLCCTKCGIWRSVEI